MAIVINGTSGVTYPDNTVQASAGYPSFKNRIINGAMMIAQRATSASPTAGGYFTVDRWRFGQASSYASSLTPTISQSSTAPAGFINSFLYTNGTGASPTSAQLISLDQYIEGLNCADLDFGASTAATVTVSFWVRASVTGTYAVALTNDSVNRSYVTTYTVNAANTWEQKSVTIAGDTSGTWLKTNGTGILVRFPIGAGSNLQTTAGAWQAGNYYTTSACTNLTATTGATFYITGVQLEKGSTATSFDYRPYGTELQLCQRYLPILTSTSSSEVIGSAYQPNSTTAQFIFPFVVTPRVPPTGVTISSPSHFYYYTATSLATPSAATFSSAGYKCGIINFTISGGSVGPGASMLFNNTAGKIEFTGCEL